MQVVLLSLIPLFAWGVGDYLGSKVTQKVNPVSLSLFFAAGGLLASLFLLLVYPLPTLSTHLVLFSVLASAIISLGFISMLRGFMSGPVGIVAPISNSYAIVIALIEVFFLGVLFNWFTFISIFVVVSGIALVSYTKPKENEDLSKLQKPIVWSLLALLLFGVGFIFFGQATKTGEWHGNIVVFEVVNVLVATMIWVLLQRKNRVRDITFLMRKTPYALLGGVAGFLGQATMFYILETNESIAVPAAVAAAAPLVTVLLAFTLDKEHLSLTQRLGSVIIIFGIVLLSL